MLFAHNDFILLPEIHTQSLYAVALIAIHTACLWRSRRTVTVVCRAKKLPWQSLVLAAFHV